MGQYSKAVHLLESILPSRPGDPEVSPFFFERISEGFILLCECIDLF